MNSRSIRWLAATAVGAAFLLALCTVVAYADTPAAGPAISVGAADYTAGTVHVSVEATPGLSAVHFEDGSGATLGVVTGFVGETADFDVVLRADMTVVAVGYDNSDQPVWSSSKALVLADYAPGKPSLTTPSNALISGKFSARGKAPGSAVTTVTLFVRGAVAWSGPVTVTAGAFALPAVSLPYGPSNVSVSAVNGFGHSTSASVRVYYLGKTLSYSHFVLVDKSDLELYYVYGRRVTHVWPVAIGTPATPTRTGTFKLHPWHHSSGPYGPRRMRLWKKVGKKFKKTSYYIHGNNDASSIGTMASHGCVRMYNKDAIKLSKIARMFMVQIRK